MSQSDQAPRYQVDVIVEESAWHQQFPDVEVVAQELCLASLAECQNSDRAQGALELSIVLANDDRLRQMNNQYRGLDRPTNVLAFASLDDDSMPDGPGPRMLGDVLISRDTAQREAEEQNKSLKDHVSHLIVHGTLHLLGYRHDEENEAAEMEALERRILASRAIADPYLSRARQEDEKRLGVTGKPRVELS